MDLAKHWLKLVFVLSALPGLTLLLRNSVWGADSFAFWAVSCGANYGSFLNSPAWFVWFVQNIVHCNLWVLAFVTWVLYFFALLGLYFFGFKWFKESAWRLPVYVATLTPLFFIEAIRFENDFFSWTLAFVALGLFALFMKRNSIMLLILSVLLAVFSSILWFPSVFIIALSVFLIDVPIFYQYLIISIGITPIIIKYIGYLWGSLSQGIGLNAVSEEIPLVGLIFILHILHFYNKIPKPLLFYGWGLLFLGAIKSKYMFLATPLLLMGLMAKEDKQPLQIKGKELPMWFFILFFAIGWLVMGLSMFPTQNDLREVQQAIDLARVSHVPLYNDWGDGWIITSLGYTAYYKGSPPQPDWNKLEKPFVAYTKKELPGCQKLAKKTWNCN